MTDSPAPTTTLHELFALDPFQLTRDDPRIDQMVAGLRAQRAQFIEAAAAGKPAPRQPRAKPAPKPIAPKDLDNLELEI